MMKTFSIDKAAVANNEQIALNHAMQETNLPADQLVAAHTETQFVFNEKESNNNGTEENQGTGTEENQGTGTEENQGTGTEETEQTEEEVHEEIPTYLPGSFEVEKNTDKDQAIAQAMEHFETFEGNLDFSENETHFIFHKIR